jgi:alkaline phosphatase D
MTRKKQTIYRPNELVMKSLWPKTTVVQHLDEICKTLTMASPISRRMFFVLSASVVVVACSKDEKSADSQPGTSTTTAPTTTPVPQVALSGDPFTLGVASGDPTTESVILWTRLAIDALNGGGMPDEDIDVLWEVSSTDQFTDIIASGVATAETRFGHSIHVDVPLPAQQSFVSYRFKVGDYTSPVGQTRLAAPADSVEPVRIATASCQNYIAGFYTAYDDMVQQAPDLVVFLGDYIYEGGVGTLGDDTVRLHNSEEITDINAYRNRYALYKSDPLLQAAHAVCPWVVTWDDHEVENNYANLNPQDPIDTAGFAERRATAYQVWWEHMPVRHEPPVDENLTIYRQVQWGGLVNMLVLDSRQYRDDQACGDAVLQVTPACEEALLPDRTLLGAQQETWVAENVVSDSTWTVLANQTVMTDIRLGAAILNYDQWDGYAPARDRLLDAVDTAQAKNLIVLTGDIHLAGVGQLTTTSDPETPRGIEFVSTSISSSGNVNAATEALFVSLTNIIDAEAQHRGYILHTVTADSWTADYRIVDNALVESSTVSTWKTFKVMAGSPVVTEV